MRVTNISKSFTRKMAAITSWHMDMERNYVTITLCILCLCSGLHRAVSIFAVTEGRLPRLCRRAHPRKPGASRIGRGRGGSGAGGGRGALSAPTGRPASAAGGVSITPGGTRVNRVPVRRSVRPSGLADT